MGLVQKETLVVFHIRVPRETEIHQRKKSRTQENLASNQSRIMSEGGTVKSKYPLFCTDEKRQTDDKRSTSPEASPATRAKIPCLWVLDAKDRRLIIDTLPYVVITSLETGASVATIACIDMLMVRRDPAGGRRVRVLKEQLLFSKNTKRSKVVFLKNQFQRSLFFRKLCKRD